MQILIYGLCLFVAGKSLRSLVLSYAWMNAWLLLVFCFGLKACVRLQGPHLAV